MVLYIGCLALGGPQKANGRLFSMGVMNGKEENIYMLPLDLLILSGTPAYISGITRVSSKIRYQPEQQKSLLRLSIFQMSCHLKRVINTILPCLPNYHQ